MTDPMHQDDRQPLESESDSVESDSELDAELLAEIWQMYCVDAPLNMDAIVEALAAGEITRVASLSHRLAGDSGAVGCATVELPGRELERAAGTPGTDPAVLTSLVHALTQALAEVIADSAKSESE